MLLTYSRKPMCIPHHLNQALVWKSKVQTKLIKAAFEKWYSLRLTCSIRNNSNSMSRIHSSSDLH